MKAPFAIHVESLSKSYRLGSNSGLGQTLRDTVTEFFRFEKNNNATEDIFWAIKNLNLEIKTGEVVGVVGRNGAGKSTLLKILSRITEPTNGTVKIYGRVGSLLEVGTGFHPELSGRDNIYLNGSILGMGRREIDRKFDEIVSFAEIEKFIDTPVKRYSSGMYVRLAFAVAAHLEPEILLIDEVLSVGDAAFQKKCLGKIGQVSSEGRTVLFVSHNTSALLGLCKRGILLEQGALTADGTIESVVRDYMKRSLANASGDLSSYSDRQGNGRVRFTQVTFEDAAGNFIEHGVSGQPLVIKLAYKSSEAAFLPHCRLAVTFYDNLGQALFNCSSDLVEESPINLDAQGTVKCVIPRLPLSQSHYLLTFFLEANNEIEDWLHQAVELKVIDGDYYGTGRLYPKGWQGKGVLVPYTWIAG
ncbi:MAG: ABC transporter ATP-binding protein [Acidobacteriota bacterium]|nr:ABC transporter ATP-binding protein [Acidobacteriota bacterium]